MSISLGTKLSAHSPAASDAPVRSDLLRLLRCPYEQSSLDIVDTYRLRCLEGHFFPVIQGIPVLLRPEQRHTLWVAKASWESANSCSEGLGQSDPWFINTLGLTEREREELLRKLSVPMGDAVDPVISHMVGATSGNLYSEVVGRLGTVPIPAFPMEHSPGKLLDIGCNWGRWTLAAAKVGYPSVGIDPSLGAVLAAQRLARKLGSNCAFVCGDGRYLPFAADTFSRVFSYSVIQHFSESDASSCLNEIRRTLVPGGVSLVQMPNCLGLCSLYHLALRRFRKPIDFEVRYRGPRSLKRVFEMAIGPSALSIDGFLGLGVQKSDLKILPFRARLVILISEMLKRFAGVLPPLKYVADSLYVRSIADKSHQP